MLRDTTNPPLTFFLNISLIYGFTSCFFFTLSSLVTLLEFWFLTCYFITMKYSYYKEIVIVVYFQNQNIKRLLYRRFA